MGAPREPSAFCGLYSYEILVKLIEMLSVGTASEPSEGFVWNDETRQSSILICMYSCCPPPALRTKSTAFLMCVPFAARLKSSGEDLSMCFVKWMSWNETLPAPPPPPELCEPS